MAKKDIWKIETTEQKGSFVKHVLQDLKALEKLLQTEKLDGRPFHIGSELELNFLDQKNNPSFVGYDIFREEQPAQVTTEYARFNLEINSDPIPFSGQALSALKENIAGPLRTLKQEAEKRDTNIILTGIIPTLSKRHISREALTPEKRFEALYDIRKKLHGEDYEFNIKGVDELIIHDNVLLFAGCMTSFQIHLQVSPDEIVDAYNWAQLISGPLLAAATFSPLFLGRKLWRETRIALFEQSTDTRRRIDKALEQQARVTFGEKWVEESITELFQEDLVTYEPLFTCDLSEDPLEKIEQNAIPELNAWTLFNSSIYRWNRVCYGTKGNAPSLRIENRLLPAGPTMEDQIANMAFWTGMMKGMPEKYASLQDKILFDEVKQNFLKAAHLGLEVEFKWLNDETITARDLILEELLPIAKQGLEKAEINDGEASHYLNIIRERVSSGKTGSQWIMDSYNNLLEDSKKEDALSAITTGMLNRQKSDEPVHTWDTATVGETGSLKERYDEVSKIMSTSPYKISEDTVVDLAAHIMEWKEIGHILVENEEGKLVGILNKNALINFLIEDGDKEKTVSVREIMLNDPVTVTAQTSVKEALEIMLKNDLSCLPVVKNDHAIGIVTKHDFVIISEFLISEL